MQVAHNISRGKFRSLTMINWNGFFARTFDLDQLVTTLSGGNGAGKSTTMAAFVTALIPDLTLLHFRNTTEAGASGGSRDRGLHGKLRAGVCYAILEAENSRGERLIMGARLQQVAGRDKKVDIKTFSIAQLPDEYAVTNICTKNIKGNQVRVLPLVDLGEKVSALGADFKQYQSITDYHATMFDWGVLPKRLRNNSDRSKFHKLIEASLYGGISSAITHSLRDYLLPENQVVKKAFEDMESALRENRMTLEAIKMTQNDRDLFKHLIQQTTDYVASDYMRHVNERRGNIEQALQLRQQLFTAKNELLLGQHKIVEFSRELQQLKEAEEQLEQQYQRANDVLNLVMNASRHQEKIERYQEDIQVLSEKVEEQQAVQMEAQEDVAVQTHALEELEGQIDAWRSELADYQQALDANQTRALQYQQAMQALEKAKSQCKLPKLTIKNARKHLEEFEAKLSAVTSELLDLEQKTAISQQAQKQFDQAWKLLNQIVGEIKRDKVWKEAQVLLESYPEQKAQAQLAPQLRSKLQQLENQFNQQKKVTELLQEFNQQAGTNLTLRDDLEGVAEEKLAQQEELNQALVEVQEERSQLRQQQISLESKQQELSQNAPTWLVAQSALERLGEQSGKAFATIDEVRQFMQEQLSQERDLTIQRDKLEQQRQQLDTEITRLSQPDGAEDPRMNQLAERFQGVLLSELYDDVPLEDTAYFSALYGPARNAIVVRDLNAIRSELMDLTDCPDDLYFIEGDPSAFDDNVFLAQELANGVMVQVSQREWRYSKFPAVPLFGKVAREKHCIALEAQRDEVQEQFVKVSFDLQKSQRLGQHFTEFMGQHSHLAFQPNPEDILREVQQQRSEIERQLAHLNSEQASYQQQLTELQYQLQILNKITPQLALCANEDLEQERDACREELKLAQADEQFVKTHGHAMSQFMPIAEALKADPAKADEYSQAYVEIKAQQKILQEQQFALAEVVAREAHFAYAKAVMAEESDLNKQLRQQLENAQQQRESLRNQLKQRQAQATQCHQLYLELNSQLQEKHKMLQELISEVGQLGVTLDQGAEERAKEERENLHQKLSENRQRSQFVDKQLTLIESEGENLNRAIAKAEKDYQSQREMVVSAKVSWVVVIRLSREADMEKRLQRKEWAYLSSEELRSMSDKALGALRTAVADNEYLRDSLRSSEDNRKPENKVRFFIAVYQHLRERIRQDIIKTDDPIDAIEQMEVELARLTEELNNREQKLAISSESVANIMRKTIQREQNRIRMLNQGLQNIAFGQVKSVRLVVNIRESHAMLLDALNANSPEHQDLFNDNRITFSEAMAKLYQRLNPQIDMGQRTAQTIGEALLDYRNYLDLEVEVYRGADGWLRAESGALSTGEAIGTGMSILLMVVQSWEEESRRIRAKDILPCRLLFLDEAARLDAKSIATLFELCERLDMQLLIAAPENISPENGTTYKLVRKITDNQEYVHVVGLRGFGARE